METLAESLLASLTTAVRDGSSRIATAEAAAEALGRFAREHRLDVHQVCRRVEAWYRLANDQPTLRDREAGARGVVAAKRRAGR